MAQTHRGDPQKGGVSGITQAEIALSQPQAKECPELPEVGKESPLEPLEGALP